MAIPTDNVSMALFCDFENVALGVRDAKYEKFDIKRVLERLLLKGSIVVKKAYCDWERYKGFKATMHEANFELIEIPHVRQSGKNSADIRLVVDALDLCYTKSHVDTFVIISGDSDFSPLVSKLRENAKQVIGVGVKQSTSDLLIANCDEFIFYDDLVRESERAAARRDNSAQAPVRRSAEDDKRRKEELEGRRSQAIAVAVETFEALVAERGDSGKIWASLLKEAIKRRKPDFNESYYGFRAFGNLLEEAQARGLLEVGRDDKSGTFVHRVSGAVQAANDAAARSIEDAAVRGSPPPAPAEESPAAPGESRRGSRRGRKSGGGAHHSSHVAPAAGEDLRSAGDADPDRGPSLPPEAGPAEEPAAAPAESRRGSRRGRKSGGSQHHAGGPASATEAVARSAEGSAQLMPEAPPQATPPADEPAVASDEGRRGSRRGRKSAPKPAPHDETAHAQPQPGPAHAPVEASSPPATADGEPVSEKKPAKRARRSPRKKPEADPT